MTGCLASRSSASEDTMARTFRFDAELGQHVIQFGSDFVISRLFHSGNLHVGCMRLAPGGDNGDKTGVGASVVHLAFGPIDCAACGYRRLGLVRTADPSVTFYDRKDLGRGRPVQTDGVANPH